MGAGVLERTRTHNQATMDNCQSFAQGGNSDQGPPGLSSSFAWHSEPVTPHRSRRAALCLTEGLKVNSLVKMI